jgi:hypothetical protein
MNLSKLISLSLPAWGRLPVFILAGCVVFLLGAVWGEGKAGQREIDAADKRVAQAVRVAQARERVVVKTEVKYRDRIRTIYQKGETIEKQVPVYVTRDDDSRCSINAGFVRTYDAAWTGEPAGPAAESDREPAGIPLSVVAETDAYNAAACRAWREQAIGLREFYRRLQAASVGQDDGGAQ